MSAVNAAGTPVVPGAAIRLDGVSWAMLLSLAVLWGLSFPLVEIALRGLPVVTLVALRVSLAAVFLWAIIAAMGAALPRGRAAWLGLALLGLTNNVIPFSLIVWGQTQITSGLAAVLNGTTPLFAAFIAGVVLPEERLTGQRVGGILLGIGGVALIVGPQVLGGIGEDLWGQLAIVGAAVSYAVSSVFARRMGRFSLSPLVMSAGQTTSAALVMLPAAFAIDAPLSLPMPDREVVLAMLAYALPGTVLAYVLYFAIIRRAGATNTVLVTVMVPVVALFVGAFYLGEPVTGRQLAGMGLIALGLSVIDGRLWRAATRRRVLA